MVVSSSTPARLQSEPILCQLSIKIVCMLHIVEAVWCVGVGEDYGYYSYSLASSVGVSMISQQYG